MKKLFLIFSSLLPILFFPMGKGEIKGRIVDSETGKPIPFTNIIVVGTPFGTDCKDDGSFHIIDIPPGVYEVQIRSIGYPTLTVKDVRVEIDHTTNLNLTMVSLKMSKSRSLSYVAEKEIIKIDLPGREFYFMGSEIINLPLIYTIEDYLFLYPELEKGKNLSIFLDGNLPLVDPRLKNPILIPPLLGVENIIIQKGGFNVEDGNPGYCVVNIIEKEDKEKYHGEFDFCYNFPYMPHKGNSIYNPLNFHIRPFVDTTDSLCWKGTSVLNEEERDEYVSFEGWVEYAKSKEKEGDTLSPEEWRNLFRYIYRIEGSKELGQLPGSYGNKPGYIMNVGIGGPFLVTKNLLFSIWHLRKIEPFSIPVSRDNYIEDRTSYKSTIYFKPEMKLEFRGFFQNIQTVTNNSKELSFDGKIWAEGGNILKEVAGKNFMYWVDALNPYEIRRYGIGVKYDHLLSSFISYSFSFLYLKSNHFSTPIWESKSSEVYRDTINRISFGNINIPKEVPFGYESFPNGECYYDNLLPLDFIFSTYGRMQKDLSTSRTINFSGDLTAQVNNYHQIKGGFRVEHNLINTEISNGISEERDVIRWKGSPNWGLFYLRDKISYKGVEARIGGRVDYYDWEKPKIKISPRIGFSFPLGKFNKIYLNSGYFYEIPSFEKILGNFYKCEDSTFFKGNSSLDLPRMISYEIGFERILFEQILFSLSGYYIGYTNEVGEGDSTYLIEDSYYKTYRNNILGDLKGFEFSIRKRYGMFFNGSFIYNFRIHSSQQIETSQIKKPNSDLIFLVSFNTPKEWKNLKGGFYLTLLYRRKGGEYFSFDPLADDPFSPEDSKYINNLKWQDEGYWNLLLGKSFILKDFNLNFYFEVKNLFDSKYLNADLCFMSSIDKINYLKSLHLPMYKDERYSSIPNLIGGNDRPGEVNKSYIDRPAIEYLYYTNPRSLSFGIRVDF
ncbi:MAG: TonB-dependent receptor [candidate division WOR-3 bacterium]